jgi:predicted ATPase
MRATIDWSHALLTADQRRLFRRLAVFAGGFTLEAAEFVGAQPGWSSTSPANLDALDGSTRILDELTSLVDQSLLRALDQPAAAGEGGAPRFAMLETIREYGQEQLALAGEQAETRRRHAEWCLTLAERAAPKLLGPRQADWLVRLDAEHDNLRAALQWTIAQRDAQTALRLGTALHRFWTLRGHTGEGRRWLEQALTMGGDVPPAIRAWAKVRRCGISGRSLTDNSTTLAPRNWRQPRCGSSASLATTAAYGPCSTTWG